MRAPELGSWRQLYWNKTFVLSHGYHFISYLLIKSHHIWKEKCFSFLLFLAYDQIKQSQFKFLFVFPRASDISYL